MGVGDGDELCCTYAKCQQWGIPYTSVNHCFSHTLYILSFSPQSYWFHRMFLKWPAELNYLSLSLINWKFGIELDLEEVEVIVNICGD